VAQTSSSEYDRTGDVATRIEQAQGLLNMLVDEGMHGDHFTIEHQHVMSAILAAETLLREAGETAAPLLDAAYARREAADAEAAAAVAVVAAGIRQRVLQGVAGSPNPRPCLRLVTDETIPFLAALDVLRREGAPNAKEEN